MIKDCKMVEYNVTSPRGMVCNNLMSKNQTPWTTKQFGSKFQIELSFPASIIERYELKNHFTPRLNIRFKYKGCLRGEKTEHFGGHQLQAMRMDETVDKYGQCDSVVLEFSREQIEWGEEIGLTYFQLFSLKVPQKTDRKDYANLSEHQEFKSNQKSGTKPQTSPINARSNYYSSTQLFKNRKQEQVKDKHQGPDQNLKGQIKQSKSPVNKNELQRQKQQIQELTRDGLMAKEDFEVKWNQLVALQISVEEDLKEENEDYQPDNDTVILDQASVRTSKTFGSHAQQIYKYQTHTLDQKYHRILGSLNQDYKFMQLRLEERHKVLPEQRLSTLINGSIFSNRIFTLSGFSNPQRQSLMKLGTGLGLTYSDEVCDNCLVVGAFLKSKKIQDMRKFKGCVAVNKNYLTDCIKFSAQMLTSQYKVPS